jgi:hypothetical protein
MQITIFTRCCAGEESEDSAHSTEGEESGASSGGASKSTHFSQRDNPTVVRDSRQAAMVDLSSVRKKYKGINCFVRMVV